MSQALNSYKYENKINLSINDVKAAIKDILEKNKTTYLHDAKDIDDIFETYSFERLKCSYLVALTKINDNTTRIVITCSERVGGINTSMASLQCYASEFLNVLVAKLNGANDEEMVETIKQNNAEEELHNFAAIISISIIGTIILLALCFM